MHVLPVFGGGESAVVIFRSEDCVESDESLLALESDVVDEAIGRHAFRLYVVNRRLERRRLQQRKTVRRSKSCRNR